ncbi:MAG TPA: adenylate/guanylate cyclase domain-containing protein [Acidimicrobiales bacterium]|nr:adenylate/guanylate cyclase domain-containing protein [Acidimicrobiales bacterium]
MDEWGRLVALLESLGATSDEVEAARDAGTLGPLALDLALRGDGPTLPMAESTARHGVPLELATRYWRALGFADVDGTTPVPADAGEALALVGTVGRELLGEDGTLALARVLGSSTARLAQAMVDSFRARFEAPQLAAGAAYPDVVADYVRLARDVLPPFLDAMGAVLRRHLVVVAAGNWSSDRESTATRRHVAVGFIDLVGYTALARTLGPSALGRLISTFEDVVTEASAGHRGRVVKLLGDAAMFAADNAADACGIALDVVEAAAGAGLPPLRGGLAMGEAVALQGDLFGDVVNLAARLVAVAPEGLVLADEALKAVGAEGITFEPLAPQPLKGFDAPAVAYAVRRR